MADFNEMVNEADPESTVEQVQEAIFFALLALINLLQKNSACQTQVREEGGIETLMRQIRSSSFEPKMTALLCLQHSIESNPESC